MKDTRITKLAAILFLALLGICPFLITAKSTGADIANGADLKIARLVSLCKLWGMVKYFHPALAERPDIDWDAALVAAIPKVRAATTSAEFANAIQTMLAVGKISRFLRLFSHCKCRFIQ